MQMLVYREAVRTLQPTIEPIFAAIEKGLAAAAEEHSSLELRRTDDPWFHAHLARRIACDALVAVGLQAFVVGKANSHVGWPTCVSKTSNSCPLTSNTLSSAPGNRDDLR